jgi:L-alanine-DL-glutamate epimerase-like enolase superfamily enzyme
MERREMKITDIKVSIVEVESPMGGIPTPIWQNNLVQVFTDEGITGNHLNWGPHSHGQGLAETVASVIKPMIVGRDPFDRESIWHLMVDRGIGGVSMFIAGAIDVALWDIAGKALGLPIYKLLGGYRDKVRAYASILQQKSPQAYYDYAKELIGKGYTAIKLHVWGGPKDHLEACRATRDAVGDNVDIMLDVNCRYDRREAIMVGRELEKMNFYWYEDPLPNTDIEGYRELCQALDIPVAATETLSYANQAHFTPYMVDHIADIIRTDAKHGITLVKKVADMCDAFGLKYELHSWGFTTCQFANLNIIGACRNSDFFEKMEPGETYDACAIDTIKIDKEGFVHLPSKPGLGLEFDADEIKRRTILTL